MLKTMEVDEELSRVLSNPENLILSDSLKDRIDLGVEENIETIVKFFSNNKIVSGNFKNYKTCSKQKTSISFICEKEKLNELMDFKLEDKCEISILNHNLKGTLKNISIDSLGPQVKVKVSFIKTA